MSSTFKSTLEFSFRQRFGKINWDQLLNLDLDSILATGDIESLQSIIENLTYSTLDREDLDKFHNSNVVKVFRISQLAVEYLMSVQNHSEEAGNSYISKHKKLYEENCFLKETLKSYSEEIENLKSEYFEKRKKIKIQENLFKQPGIAAKLNKSVTRDNAVPCDICEKYFSNGENLERHKKRRHTVNDSLDSSKTVDWTPMFEMMKTFTEQKITLVSESNRQGIESLKELLKLQIELQSQKESQYFERMLKMLKDQQSLMQEEKFKPLLMEMKFEKEKLNEDFEEGLRKAHDTERKLRFLMEQNENLNREVQDKQKDFEELMSNENSINEIFEDHSRFHEGSHPIFREDRETPAAVQRHFDSKPEEKEENKAKKPEDFPKELKEIQEKTEFEEKNKFPEKSQTLKVPDENFNPFISHEPPAVHGRAVSIEEDYELPVLTAEVQILNPSKVKESNAGELISDSESEESKHQQTSNCGELVSDSDASDKESFIEKSNVSARPVFMEEQVSFDMNKHQNQDFESGSDVSAKSKKIVPKEMTRDEIAKSLGINPKVHQRYMFIVDRFTQAPLPDSWKEHVQDDGTYFIDSKGGVSIENPKIPYWRDYFSSLKISHYNIADKIQALTKETLHEDSGLPSHFKHSKENIEEHKIEMKEKYLDRKEIIKKGRKLGKKEFSEKINFVEKILKNHEKYFESFKINSEKSSENPKKFTENPEKPVEKEKKIERKQSTEIFFQKSSDLQASKASIDSKDYEESKGSKSPKSPLYDTLKSPKPLHLEKEEFKSRDFSEISRNTWSQGIKLIQDKSILKEKQVIRDGQRFVEGNVLGDSNFEKAPGLSEETTLKTVKNIQFSKTRALFKLQNRRKQKFDFES